MKPLKMIENSEIKGVWWIPENPEDKLHGTLTFSPYKGVYLEVQGSFQETNKGSITVRKGDVIKKDIILGFSIQGERITLYKCYKTHSEMHFPGMTTNTFRISVEFIGVHFEKLSDIKFKKISVEYNNLNEWLNPNSFHTKQNVKDTGLVEVKVRYERPMPVEINLDKKGVKILLEFHTDPIYHSISQKELCIKQVAFLTFEFSEEVMFNDLRNYIYTFQNLLSLLISSKKVYPIKIIGKSEKAVQHIKDEKFYNEISILYQLYPPPKFGEKALYHYEMLYPYSSIKDKIALIFNNWLEKTTELQPTFNIYLEVVYNESIMTLEDQFLNLVKVLEAYHRRRPKRFKNEDIPEEEHKKRISEILNNVPATYRSWLKEKLRYSNEPSLRKRLKEICEALKNITYITKIIPDKKAFIDKIVNERNYLVHYDRSLEKEGNNKHLLDFNELYQVSQILKILIRVLLLKEIEFSDEEINNVGNKIAK